jgi:hypothetical protein
MTANRPDPRYDPEDDLPEPPQVRRLRLLVNALIFVLIAGVVTVAATLVIRLGAIGPAEVAPIAAETLALPPGEAITAIGRAGGEVLVTTRDDAGAERLRAFDAATGAERSVTTIVRD